MPRQASGGESVDPVIASPRVTRVHYAWVVVAVTALTLLVGAGVRAAPGVLIKPLEAEFGWSRAEISLAVAISILAFGLAAPLAGSLIDRFGPRLVMLGGAALTAAGLVPLLAMRELWQMHLFWGLVTGAGTGAVSGALGATVAMRWFKKHRGVIIGLFGAATSAGQLVFLPLLVALTVTDGWRSAIGLLAAATVALLLPIGLLMRNRPADVGLRPLGDDGDEPTASERAEETRRTPLRTALRTRDFWLLAGSFFICGYTTNGLIGTHLIPHAVEHGFTEVTAANAVALMGAMNVVGTLLSGWLTDRFDNRRLLATYYTFRALSIAALPLDRCAAARARGAAALSLRRRLRAGLDRDRAADGEPDGRDLWPSLGGHALRVDLLLAHGGSGAGCLRRWPLPRRAGRLSPGVRLRRRARLPRRRAVAPGPHQRPACAAGGAGRARLARRGRAIRVAAAGEYADQPSSTRRRWYPLAPSG